MEGERVPVLVTVHSQGGLTGAVVISTTGDTTLRRVLNRSTLRTVPPGATIQVPLDLYINPQQIRGGTFRAYVWLGTPSEPLVYRDVNRDNNYLEVSMPARTRQRHPVFGSGVRIDSSESCDESRVGTSCQVQPAMCSGRGPDWTVSGTLQCVRGVLECVARPGIDYCDHCGGDCGGCVTESCSETSQCAPGSLCIDSPAIYPRPTCRDLNDDYVSRQTGIPVCTAVPDFCWTPDEAGMPEIICRESSP
jgi:hypothetical protein